MRFWLMVFAAGFAGSATAQEELRGKCDAINTAVAALHATAVATTQWVALMPDDIEQLIEFGHTAEAEARIRETFENSTVLSASDANRMIELFTAIAAAAPALERVAVASEGFDTSC